ncbi:hypothetical protein CISG_07882 [Coccidioides immitis RMSCC 3703]|uniref:Uncharacterized protein n=2 Tax=Coccidioides immitis TaxID=5501 RepID=A0A0J8R3Z0_COCIT|nr:hypothetical protein CIRG_04289 [Coccidioides immitis RMSCC 2394]KMU79451.1 hypothetical protein CISG_07882 [Coccidioides immitis RMSCC 3703]
MTASSQRLGGERDDGMMGLKHSPCPNCTALRSVYGLSVSETEGRCASRIAASEGFQSPPSNLNKFTWNYLPSVVVHSAPFRSTPASVPPSSWEKGGLASEHAQRAAGDTAELAPVDLSQSTLERTASCCLHHWPISLQERVPDVHSTIDADVPVVVAE